MRSTLAAAVPSTHSANAMNQFPQALLVVGCVGNGKWGGATGCGCEVKGWATNGSVNQRVVRTLQSAAAVRACSNTRIWCF
jgi:hypothetical protein